MIAPMFNLRLIVLLGICLSVAGCVTSSPTVFTAEHTRQINELSAKLQLIKEGMTRAEINNILKPKHAAGLVISGIETAFYEITFDTRTTIGFSNRTGDTFSPDDVCSRPPTEFKIAVNGEWITFSIKD